jgi:hypothetical protein
MLGRRRGAARFGFYLAVALARTAQSNEVAAGCAV